MAIIWLVEKPNSGDSSLALKLQGDFPVRLIGSFSSLERLLRLHKQSNPDVVILNTNDFESEGSGRVVKLKARFPQIAFQIIAAKVCSQWTEEKVISPTEAACGLNLSRKIRALLEKKRSGASTRHLRCGDLELDCDHFVVRQMPEGDDVFLPAKEARILKVMMENPGQCLKRELLQEAAWGSLKVSPRTIDSHISRLRKRLSTLGVDIQNIYGGGYLLVQS